MGHLHLLLDEKGLEEMGLDKMGINHVTVAFLIVRVHSVYRVGTVRPAAMAMAGGGNSRLWLN